MFRCVEPTLHGMSRIARLLPESDCQTSSCGFAERSNGAPGRRQRLDAATGDGWSSYHVTAQADGIGNQILSRHPILSTDAYHMQVNGPFRRAVTEATWSLAENR